MITFDYGDKIDNPYNMWLYINRTDVYARQTDYGYCREFKAIDMDVLDRHTNGWITVGTYQLDEDSLVKWLCIDVDAHSEHERMNAKKKSFEIFCHLHEAQIPFVLESSGSPDSYHFWIFLVRTNSEKAYWFGRELMHGIDVEVYPKQKELDRDRKPYGNLVKLPFGVNNKTGVVSELVYTTNDLRYIDINGYDPSAYISWLERERGMTHIPTAFMPNEIRPCMKACATGEIVMTGTSGHLLRCALVPELRLCGGYTKSQVAKVFENQPDFDFDKTMYQVNSVWDYNRFTCAKLKKEAYNKVGEYCNGCEYQ